MKRKLWILLLLLVCSLTAVAQGRYRIYRVSGSVKVQPFRSQAWQPLEKRQAVSLVDLLHIPEGASVAIVDGTTRALYRSTRAGEMRVKELIDEATRRSEQLCRELNAEIYAQLDEARQSKLTYAMTGAVYRGQQQGETPADAIYATLCGAVEAVRAGERPGKRGRWSLQRMPLEDGEFCLVIENHTNESQAVNVLRVSQEEATFCFRYVEQSEPAMVLVPAGGRVEVSQYRFFEEANDVHYLLVVTDEPYSPVEMEMRLKRQVAPVAEPSASVQVVEEKR
ncbi:MAG: hypothetical protein IJW80_02170 [Alistipes sp.]|nr:hypothetical protein [Alistipes sp.]